MDAIETNATACGPLKWETVPNHNAAVIHTRHLLPPCGEDIHELPKGLVRDMALSLIAIHGVQIVSISRYSILICKGELFTWEELRGAVNATIARLGPVKQDGPAVGSAPSAEKTETIDQAIRNSHALHGGLTPEKK